MKSWSTEDLIARLDSDGKSPGGRNGGGASAAAPGLSGGLIVTSPSAPINALVLSFGTAYAAPAVLSIPAA